MNDYIYFGDWGWVDTPGAAKPGPAFELKIDRIKSARPDMLEICWWHVWDPVEKLVETKILHR